MLLLKVLILSLIYLISEKNIIHFFQLDSYQFPSFFRTIKRNFKHSIVIFLVLTLLNVLYFIVSSYIIDNFAIKSSFVLLYILSIYINNKYKAKKPFVFTNRAKRLIIISFIITLLSVYLILSNIIFIIYPIFIIPLFSISALLAWPIEKLINEAYFNDAKKKINSYTSLTKIAITGSWGKTSTKNILGNILNEYIPTLISPKSFNTPMGLTITIRKHLEPHHRVFVAEMGSRHLGDINKLCKLVKPDMAIITSVGAQHLDTFKSVDNVKKAKYEIIKNLNKDGVSFFQDDQSIVRDMYKETSNEKYLVSLYDKNADIFVDNISIDENGSSFEVHIKNKGSFICNTVLLGEHNIKNIAISIAVSLKLNIPIKIIRNAIKKLKPIENRMEIIKAKNYTIINDAFNSNQVGSKEAVSILSKFKNRKIIITPGMVELGKEEANINYNFGVTIGKNVDIAILIGKKHIIPIKEGILSTGFSNDNLFVLNSLEESTILLNKIVKDGDVVLYENDLPDNYIDA